MVWPFSRSAPDQPPAVRVEPEVSRSGTRARQHVRNLRVGQYAAAQSDRLTRGWGTHPLAADDIIRLNQRVLVARSREQAANSDHARKFVRLACKNIIGARGVQLQAQPLNPDGTLDRPAEEAIERAWDEWCAAENCDVTGRLSFRRLQRALVSSAAVDGEFFARLIFGREAGPWGFALQMIDPQLCPVHHDVARLSGGRFIRHGIEFTELGRPVAYYFSTVTAEDPDYRFGGRDFVRVPAEEIVHGFEADMVGQKRGLPWMATSLLRLHHLSEYERAALVNAREGANKQGFIGWEEGYGPEADDDDVIEIRSEPGTYHELPRGAKFVPYDPAYPNGEFQVFSKHMLRSIAAGMDVAYNNLASDLEGVNFSSIRQGTLDERDMWRDRQEWFCDSFLRPVYDAWLRVALLAGRIRVLNGLPLRPERLEKFRRVEWQPRRWDWIDPRSDVEAAIKSAENLFSSPSQIIRDRGRDPQSVWREIARDLGDMEAAGIPREVAIAVITKQTKGGTDGGPQAGDGAPAAGGAEAQAGSGGAADGT